MIDTNELKYPKTPHWPYSESVHRSDTYHTNSEFFVGKEVIVTEKLDGGNTMLYGGEVFARSTSQPATQGWFSMVKKHHAYKSMQWGIVGNSPLALYGEDIYGIHSIEYNPVKENETFYLFALRFAGSKFGPSVKPEFNGDIFLDWKTTEEFANNHDMKTVPVIFKGVFNSVSDITEFFKFELRKDSMLGGNREGFVMRVASEFETIDFSTNVCKYVRANHVQTNEHWTKNWKPCKIRKD